LFVSRERLQLVILLLRSSGSRKTSCNTVCFGVVLFVWFFVLLALPCCSGFPVASLVVVWLCSACAVLIDFVDFGPFLGYQP
jgi:hypothetical protein